MISHYKRRRPAQTENKCSIPLTEKFWVDLIANATEWGLAVYEQDWLHNEFEKLDATRQSATLARQWLLQMGAGADASGVKIQYCMPYPRHIMQSVEVPAVTQVRASDDYHPNNDQWSIGVSAIFSHSLGLAPFKDDFWTTTAAQPGNPYHETNEATPYIEALSATLSTGPVGPSDMIGLTNATLVNRIVASNGRILKPSAPALALDSTFTFRAFGSNGPNGEVWSTYSEVSNIRWGILLGAALTDAYAVTPTDMGVAMTTSNVMARRDLCTDLVAFSSSEPILLNKATKAAPQLWHTVPALANGFYVLGEVDKIVPMSPARFTLIGVGGEDVEVRLQGGPNEAVAVTYSPDGATILVAECTLGAGGTGSIVLQKTTSACL